MQRQYSVGARVKGYKYFHAKSNQTSLKLWGENLYIPAGVVLKKKGPHRRRGWVWVVGSPPPEKKRAYPFFLRKHQKDRVEPVRPRGVSQLSYRLYYVTSTFPQERSSSSSSSSGSLEGSDEEDGEEH